MKINYVLNNKGIITYWCEVPFDKEKDWIEIPDGTKVHSGFDKIIDGVFVADEAGYKAHLKKCAEKDAIVSEIFRLKKLLADSDYKLNKFLEGEMTEEEYAPIKAQRHEWRVKINELEAK